MNTLVKIIFLFLISNYSFAQEIIAPGEYDDGLKLAYDSNLHKITGYYESYTGWDEQTKNPRFSCIFYFEGTVTGTSAKLNTFYPTDKSNDLIQGTMAILNAKSVQIKLSEEHGGCWNVQHFTDEPVQFDLQLQTHWTQIRYVEAAKIYFYNSPNDMEKLPAYIIKGDVVCIEKIEKDWAYCYYFGEKITKGWIKTEGLNKL